MLATVLKYLQKSVASITKGNLYLAPNRYICRFYFCTCFQQLSSRARIHPFEIRKVEAFCFKIRIKNRLFLTFLLAALEI